MHSSFHWSTPWLSVITFVVMIGSLRAEDTIPGLFADVQTTLGAFTIQLAHEKAPRTVANFVGLAEGSQPWVDPSTGEVRREPFYRGITFHRVVEGFVIQAGSPAGDGTDGPGYTFRDEFVPSLRHNKPYIVSMANSGPNSNGSQFFITLAETPFLDYKHSVFGEVVSGMDVVDRLGQVTVDARNDRPMDPLVIESVTVRREGDVAQGFDLMAHGLPKPQDGSPRMRYDEDRLLMDLERSDHTAYQIYRTEDLRLWSRSRLPIIATDNSLDITNEVADVAQRFYRVARIDYPEPVLTSASLLDQMLTLNITSHDWNLILRINDQGTGSFDYDLRADEPTKGEIDTVEWLQEAYRGVIMVRFAPEANLVPLRCSLVYGSQTEGWFKGTALRSTQPFEIAGTFTIE